MIVDMTDLEEKFLKKNIPGKYSTWSEYRDGNENETRRSNEDNDDEDQLQGDHHHDASCHDNSTSTVMNQSNGNGASTHNTGIKGVLSDHRQAKQFEKLQIAQEQQERQEAFRQATNTTILQPGEQSLSIASLQQMQRQERDLSSDSESDSDSDSFDDDEDDEFLQSYRQARLSQMKSYPTFGSITEVPSALQFSKLIDETPPKVYSIFHLYDSSYPMCRTMNELLDKLARDMDYARFFRMEAKKVKENFDPIGFPCILVYCDGREVANLTPITKRFDSYRGGSAGSAGSMKKFTAEDVEAVLVSCGIQRP